GPGRREPGGEPGAVAAGGRTTTDGIYVMTADQGDVLGQGDTAFAGGINWTTGGSNSPWKITVAPDDSVYIADWSDLNSGVWRCNANPQSNFDEILTNVGRTSTGLVAGVHGSVASVYIEGTGANTVLYTLDEDFNAGSGMGSILRYDIGTQTGYSGTPVEQTQDIPNHIQNSNMDFVRDSDGSWWICQYRYTDSDAVPTLLHWADGASSPSWKSGPSTVALDRGYGILAIDNLNDLIAVGTNNSKIYILDISDPSNVALVDTIAHSGATIRDLDFDAAGNLYVVSSSSETLRIYSPGGDWMAITGSDGSFVLIPEPAAVVLLALGGLACLRRRRIA
ncbi:MAG TPA: PEP-CTERM sorting domain-containing protein, partial [Phycisphaerae bacterium]|nr:PEP-CTERM sorting domain-containing protein [Phycisphaerae bacterium]